jgi:hypothetical protein
MPSYPVVRERFGARGIRVFPKNIPYSMGSQLELRIEFPNHQIDEHSISTMFLSLWRWFMVAKI